ncbi:MAG: peptide chain release factor 1 [Saprospiraceae bacterium]
MLDKLEAIQERFYYLEERLSDPSIVSDQKVFAKTNKDYSALREVVEVFKEYKEVLGNIDTAKEMLAEDDPDMKEMAKDELNELNPKKQELEETLKTLLIPKDPEDEKDVIVEIRSGTGGDEAAIFAGDLYKMYSRFFDRQGWKTEVLNITEGTAGGYSKLVLEVSGNNVYGRLKFESGAHRVQRVPKTESQGRVHTSAATVVVMPKLEMEDVNIVKSDLKVDTFRSSGAGGQHVNKTESGVRFTHLPTGVVAESTDGRSQIQNREIALQRLYQKVYDQQRAAHDSKVAAARKSLVGSGDRSGKVRTYNYPQNRVTDHRINLTLYSLDKIVEGDIEEILQSLQVAENAEKMKAEAEMQ